MLRHVFWTLWPLVAVLAAVSVPAIIRYTEASWPVEQWVGAW